MAHTQQKAFERVLALIEAAGCQRHVILIGSWAEFVYRETGMLGDFAPNIRTLDIDFLVRNLRKPNPPASLAALARQEGFLVESDRLNATTKLFDPSGLEVEFLINRMGAGVETALKTNVGVTAQALRHMDILSGNTIEAICLGHLVLVPTPEAYAIHKMVINSQRNAKANKDAQAVRGIWPYLDKRKVDALSASLTKKEKSSMLAFMARQNLA